MPAGILCAVRMWGKVHAMWGKVHAMWGRYGVVCSRVGTGRAGGAGKHLRARANACDVFFTSPLLTVFCRSRPPTAPQHYGHVPQMQQQQQGAYPPSNAAHRTWPQQQHQHDQAAWAGYGLPGVGPPGSTSPHPDAPPPSPPPPPLDPSAAAALAPPPPSHPYPLAHTYPPAELQPPLPSNPYSYGYGYGTGPAVHAVQQPLADMEPELVDRVLFEALGERGWGAVAGGLGLGQGAGPGAGGQQGGLGATAAARAREAVQVAGLAECVEHMKQVGAVGVGV